MEKCNMVLPKLWLQRISKFWDKVVPEDYPETSSEFSLKFSSDEVSNAVKSMEDELNTENSIITEDMISEGERLGGYLGTYDVSGTAGELTLISPEKVSSYDIGVVAFHYNEADSNWEQIEDAQIIDGYVYGTVESFSPIAIFTIRKDTIFQENNELIGTPVYVANGIPIVITKNENGEVVVKDANGKETIVPEDTSIVCGTIDGTDVESTSVFAKGITLKRIKTGSYSVDGIVKVGKISCTVEDCELTSGISGGSFNCRVEDAEFNVKNTTSYFFGTGESIIGNKDSNKFENLGLGSNAWIRNAVVNIENSNIEILYAGGNTGYFYVHNVDMTVKGGKYKYVTTGGSNGLSNSIKLNISDAEIELYQSVNRGIVNESKAKITNCKVEKLYTTFSGEITEPSSGTVKSVNMDITGGEITLYAGNNNKIPLDAITAKEIIKTLKISRTTTVNYGETNTLSVLGDIIKIK